jgi:hypothetical protein
MAKSPEGKGSAPLLISIAQASLQLGVSQPTVRRMLGKQLAERRIGRRRLVVVASLASLVTEPRGGLP